VIHVTVWGENVHEKASPVVAEIYPEGMHECIAEGLRQDGNLEVRTATWTCRARAHPTWSRGTRRSHLVGHAAHVASTTRSFRVSIGASSRNGSRGSPLRALLEDFRRLLGTTCSLKWREAGERERVWVCDPSHPIAAGIGECIESRTARCMANLSRSRRRRAGLHQLVRGRRDLSSGCCWKRGAGKVFYFSPSRNVPHLPQPRGQARPSQRVQVASAAGRWVDACPMSHRGSERKASLTARFLSASTDRIEICPSQRTDPVVLGKW